MRRSLLTLLCCVLAAACGFHPLNSKEYRAQQDVSIATVDVKVDHSRLGQLLEAEIRDNVNPDYQQVTKLYRLEVKLALQDVALFINPDGTSARGDINWISSYKLIKISDNTVISQGSITRTSSYNTGEDASTGYASFVSVEDAKKRGVIELAQDYKMRIANALQQYKTLGAPAAPPPQQAPVPQPYLPSSLQPALMQIHQ